jgi:hypothetical protein
MKAGSKKMQQQRENITYSYNKCNSRGGTYETRMGAKKRRTLGKQ